MKYSFIKGLSKALQNTILFGFPIAVQFLPETWMNLTVGGILTLFFNYIKVRWEQSEPVTK